jgi:hypothetical protein
MYLYKDGSFVGIMIALGTLSTDDSVPVAVGNQPDGAGDKPFDGRIDDVRIYNCALTHEHIQALASCQEPDFGGAGGGEISP